MEKERKPFLKEAAPAIVERDDVRVATSLVRCPFCHTGIAPDATEWVACFGCLARHHATCWDERGACSTCGEKRSVSQASRQGAPPPRTRGTSSKVLQAAIVALTLASPLALHPLWMLYPREELQWAYVLLVLPLLALAQGAVSRSVRGVLALPLIFMAAATVFMVSANPDVTINVVGILIAFFGITLGGWGAGALGIALGRRIAGRGKTPSVPAPESHEPS